MQTGQIEIAEPGVGWRQGCVLADIVLAVAKNFEPQIRRSAHQCTQILGAPVKRLRQHLQRFNQYRMS